jgi:hypothetical protein
VSNEPKSATCLTIVGITQMNMDVTWKENVRMITSPETEEDANTVVITYQEEDTFVYVIEVGLWIQIIRKNVLMSTNVYKPK